jgi:TRAP transporter TAXI family solute receptor
MFYRLSAAFYVAMILLVSSLFPLFPASASEMGMVTGPQTGTYIAVGNDIAKIARNAGIRISVKPSKGSIDNIRRITSNENAALGIVQADVLGFLSRSQSRESRDIVNRLRLIAPLYQEEVHILSGIAGIRNASELTGKRVAVGPEGSGSWLTAMNLFAMLNIKPLQVLRIPHPEGMVKLLKGEVDALIFVGGKPVKLFKNIENLSNRPEYSALMQDIHFVPLDNPVLLQEYSRATIDANDYSYVKSPVPTIAVSSVLMTHDFSATSDYARTRCRQLSLLGRAIRSHLNWLKTNGHPKWREVDLMREVSSWQKDNCAWQEPELDGAAGSALEKDLLNIIRGQ